MKNDQTLSWLKRSMESMGGATLSDLRRNRDRLAPVYDRGLGSRVWDVDGNEYIDYLVGGGPVVLGHCHPAVVSAIQNQLEKGIMFGAQTELDIRLAEKFCEIVPCAEIVRFGCTGSEVDHSAIRLARGCTGRSKVLRFEGHFHGWYDTMGWDTPFTSGEAGPRENPRLRPLSSAQPDWASQDWLVLPWNDLDRVEDLFKVQGDRIAAILTEPIMSQGGIGPLPGYLEGLREICDRWGALLIFDEVVTGFRVALGGAQELYGVTPDLATFAKSMGSGVVVSALAGKRRFMERVAEFFPIVAGTYNGNPLSMAGALATLETLGEENGKLLRRSHEIAALLADEFIKIPRNESFPMVIRQFPGSNHVSFVPDPEASIVDARSLMQTDFRMTQEFAFALQRRGIRAAGSGGWGVTAAHTIEDVEETLPRVLDALEEVSRLGLKCQPHVPTNSNGNGGATRRAGIWKRLFSTPRTSSLDLR